MKIIILDKDTISNGDVDFSKIEALGKTDYFNRLSEEEIIRLAKDAEALLINKTSITENLIKNLPRLKYIGAFATGYNNVDIAACDKYGITFSNAPDYSTDAVAQHTFSLMLMAMGNTHLYAQSVRNGDWINSGGFSYYAYPQSELSGKTLGVFGYGAIGKKVAKIGEAFGMKIIVCTRTKDKSCPYPYVEMEELFSKSDVLSLHAPLNEETRHVVNERTLSLIKNTAVIVNTSRGGLICEEALAQALNDGRIRAAALDVLEREPMQKDCPLTAAKNVIITPHVAWEPIETRKRLIGVVADNLKAFIDGKPQNVITLK